MAVNSNDPYAATDPNAFLSPEQRNAMMGIAQALYGNQITPGRSGNFEAVSPLQSLGQIVNALAGRRLMDQQNKAYNSAHAVPPVQPPQNPNDPMGATSSPSDDAIGFIKKQEGWSSKAYKDYHQYSIGYGTKASGPDETIDRDEGERRLTAEVGSVQQALDQRFPNLTPAQKNALTSFTYNVGTGWMSGSKLSKAIDGGDWNSAANVMLSYNHAGGAVNSGLTGRRIAEAKMMLGGPQGGQDNTKLASAGPNTDAPPPAVNGPPGAVPPAQTPPQAPPAAAGANTPPPGTQVAQNTTQPPQTPGGPPAAAFRRPPQISWDAVQRGYASSEDRGKMLEKMYIEQFQPAELQEGGVTYRLPYGSSTPIPIRPAPTAHNVKFPGYEGPMFTRTTPTGEEEVPVQPPGSRAATAPGASGDQPPEQGNRGLLEGAPRNVKEGLELDTKHKADVKMAEETATEQAKNYDKIHTGLTGNAMIYASQKPNIDALRKIAQDPDLWTGSGANSALAMQRLAAQVGVNLKSAAPREAFNMLAAKILANQFSGIRSTASETGETGSRIFLGMLKTEQDANITPEDSQAGVLAKLDLMDRAGNLGMKYADMADDYVAANGHLDAKFNKAIRAEIAKGRIMPEGETVTGGKIPQHSPVDVETEMRRRGLIK